MRTFSILKASLLVLALALPGVATAETNIAVIDQERVLFGSDAAQAASAQLQQDFSAQEGQVRQLEEDINTLRERGQNESALMSEQEVEALRQEVQEKMGQRQQLVQQLQNAQQQRRQAFVQQYEGDLTAILEQIIEERGIDLLISADEVLFAQPAMDITEETLSRFNASLDD